jgi:hypothetical protein
MNEADEAVILAKVNPLPGHVYVKIESFFRNTGPIVIPDKYKTAPHVVGRVVKYAFKPGKGQVQQSDLPISIGCRVIVSHACGSLIPGTTGIMDFPFEYRTKGADGKPKTLQCILAILGDDVKIGTQTQPVERCHVCGNAREGIAQGMLLQNNICPRCGRDAAGNMVDTSVRVTEDERKAFRAVM